MEIARLICNMMRSFITKIIVLLQKYNKCFIEFRSMPILIVKRNKFIWILL